VTIGLSLVVFAYNEAENVPAVLGEVLAWLRRRVPTTSSSSSMTGSTDGTRAAAETVLAGDRAARVVSHDRNRGIGAALKTGVRAASKPWVTFLPCDGQIPPASSTG
jgi:glycosyltransferase involved in cell wall biosynthesis